MSQTAEIEHANFEQAVRGVPHRDLPVLDLSALGDGDTASIRNLAGDPQYEPARRHLRQRVAARRAQSAFVDRNIGARLLPLGLSEHVGNPAAVIAAMGHQVGEAHGAR